MTILLLTIISISAYSQGSTAVYPVEVSTFITPPYGTCLKDFVGSQRFQVHVLLRDLSKKNDDFVIIMSVKDGGGRTIFRSNVGKFSFANGSTMIVPAEVAPHIINNLFREENIEIGREYANKCFPEGAYSISFQAFDAKFYSMAKRRIPLSRESVTTMFMQSTDSRAYLVYPYKDEVICKTEVANVINYQWQPANPTGEAVSYHLEVVELQSESDKNSPHKAFQYGRVVVDADNLYRSIYTDQITETSYREGYYYAWRVTVKKGYDQNESKRETNQEVRVFQYRCNPVEEPEDTYDPKIIAEKNIKSSLDQITLEEVSYTGADALLKWKEDPEEIRQKYCGVGVEIRKYGGEKWTAFKNTTTEEFEYSLSKLSYNVSYQVRAHYIQCPEEAGADSIYGPYSNVLEFSIPKEDDDSECGSKVPDLADCTDRKAKVLRAGDTIIANGTKIFVDKITSYSSDSSEITGEGHVCFPILTNIQLRMKFNNIKINCEGELAKGEIHAVYDVSTCAMIDFEEFTGENFGGGTEKSPSESKVNTMENFNNGSSGDYFKDTDGTIYMKDEDGNKVKIGQELKLDNTQFSFSQDALTTEVHFVQFSNPSPETVAFDNDKDGYYRGFPDSKYGSYSDKYVIPYLANNPGRMKKLNASEVMLNNTVEPYEDVKFVIEAEGGTYIELIKEDEEKKRNTCVVNVPGSSNCDNIIYVRVLGKLKDSDQYQMAGKLIVCNYKPRTHKLIIVPTSSDYTVDKTKIESGINRIYGRLGITFEVTVDRTFENNQEVLDLLEDGLDISTDDQEKRSWDVESPDMKTIRRLYQESHPDMEKEAAYLFLVNKPEEKYAGVEGDMPRNQSVGYIFMNGKNELTDSRLIAHELGHGVFRLQHTFAYNGKESTEKKTDNLMDYNPSNPDFLAHFQWEVLQNTAFFVWKAFQDDEDGMFTIPPCVYKSAASMVGSSVAGGLADYAINQAIGTDIDKEKSLKDCIGEGFSDNFTVANTIRTVAETCFSLDDYAHYISMLFNAGSSASDYFDCRDEGGDFCHCLVKSVTNFLLSTIVDEVKKKLSERLSKKHPNLSSDKKKAVCEKLTSSMFDYFKLDSKIAAESVSAVAEGLFDGIMDGTDSKISSKIVEGLSGKLADLICKEAETPKVENIRIEIDKDKILHVYLYTKIKDNTQLNKTRAVVYPVVVGYDEADPCNKEKYKVEASENINLTSNYFDYNNLPDQKWYQTDKSFLKSLSYSDNLSFETLMDGQDKNVSAFVFGDKYCSVDNISSDKLSLYEVGVMTVSVKGFNWDGDYEGWFVNKSKILDERVYHYIAKLPCQNDKIFTAKVVGKGVIVIDDNYVDADSKPKDYHCGLAIPHCSDDEPGPTPGSDIVPKTVTEKDECSESDLFKGTASTSKAAKALANEARIKKGECVYGLPKCSKWIKDSNKDKVYHITSSPICGGNNSDDVVDLFTVTLNKAGVPEKGSRVMNNEVAMNNLYKVFSYECGADSMLVEDTIPAHVGKAIMVSADQYFAKYALRIFVKVSYDWAKNRISYSSANNQDLNQAFNDLLENWKKKNVFPNPIDYALDRPTGNPTAGPKHLMNIIENSSYSSQLKKNIRSNLKAGNRQIDFCNLCSAFRNIYRIVALSLAEIPYSYKGVEFMYDNTMQIPSKYYSPTSEYKYIYDELFVTTLDVNKKAASSGENRSIYYTQAEADEKNKEILKNVENALSVCLATIYDDVHKASSSTISMSVNGKSFQYMPNNLGVRSVPNIAVQVDGSSCNK